MTIKKDIIAALVGIVITIILFGSLYTVKIPAPGNAVVYVDNDSKTYYAPPYIDNTKPGKLQIDVNKLKPSTLEQVRKLNYTPDKYSLDNGYFQQRYRPLTSYLLEKIGLREPLPRRWTPDGQWNW